MAIKREIRKGALLFTKSIGYTSKTSGNPAMLHVGTVKTEKDGVIEIVSSGPFVGSAVFYAEVKKGEEMWAGRVAEEDTFMLLGSNTVAAVKDSKNALAELADFDFE